MHITMANKKTKIGHIQEKILDLCPSDKISLTLNQPIFISEGNEDHIKNEHPTEYNQYFTELSNILANPDYLGVHPSGRSFQYFKFFGNGPDRILVAVRATNGGTLFVRSLYSVTEEKFNSYLESGTITKVE